ncbi:MAG: hypothetical protein EOP86_15960 [Verrucomicrobiaceae bacterium]|nr:MAG: hypothetical protein EOP86_15960 [Verrucomicrobiaceae bacterium]
MSSKASLHVWTHSRQQGGHLLVLLALADHADDNGHCSLSVSTLARMARVSERHCKRILVGLTASGELIRTRRGGGSKPVGYRLNPVDPSHDAGPGPGPTGDTHVTGDIQTFFDDSAGRVTPVSPEGWHGSHRGGDTGFSKGVTLADLHGRKPPKGGDISVTRGVTLAEILGRKPPEGDDTGVTRGVTPMPPDPLITQPPSGEESGESLPEKPVSGKAGIPAELGFAAMQNLADAAASLSAFTPAEIRSLWKEWRACLAGPATPGPVGGAVPSSPEPTL